MGFLSDLKRLFWAKKAVAKSTAEKVGDEVKDVASDGFDTVKGVTDDLGAKAGDAARRAKDYASDLVDDVWEKKDRATETMKDKGDQVADKTSETLGKAREKGAEIVDKAVDVSDKVWEKAEEVGEKVIDKGGDLVDKAKEMAGKVGDKISEKMDEMLEKAEDLDKTIEKERDAIDANRDGWADTSHNEKLREKGSLLDNKDDFWSRAEKYAEGDYSMGKPQIIKDAEPTKEQASGPVKGFEDLDGDGDEIIDDAIVVEDDTEDTPSGEKPAGFSPTDVIPGTEEEE